VAGQLRSAGDDAAEARCKVCGALAVGPCASCRAPLCGDCCVITEGGLTTFAICPGCERRSGTSLLGAWGSLLAWILGVIAVTAVAVVVVVLLWS
jgi:hypothetical protein